MCIYLLDDVGEHKMLVTRHKKRYAGLGYDSYDEDRNYINDNTQLYNHVPFLEEDILPEQETNVFDDPTAPDIILQHDNNDIDNIDDDQLDLDCANLCLKWQKKKARKCHKEVLRLKKLNDHHVQGSIVT